MLKGILLLKISNLLHSNIKAQIQENTGFSKNEVTIDAQGPAFMNTIIVFLNLSCTMVIGQYTRLGKSTLLKNKYWQM